MAFVAFFMGGVLAFVFARRTRKRVVVDDALLDRVQDEINTMKTVENIVVPHPTLGGGVVAHRPARIDPRRASVAPKVGRAAERGSVIAVDVDGAFASILKTRDNPESQLLALSKLSESKRNLRREDSMTRMMRGTTTGPPPNTPTSPAPMMTKMMMMTTTTTTTASNDTDEHNESMNRQRIKRADVEECVQLMRNADSYMKWEPLSECYIHDHLVKIYRKLRPDSDLYDIYSCGTLPMSPEELIDVNWDLKYRLKWDAYAKSIQLLESFPASGIEVDQDLVIWEVAFPWPLANRDYVFYRHRERTADGLLVLVSKGVPGSDGVAEVPGVVRVEQLRTYFVIRNAVEQPGCCEFALLYFDDLKGHIPKSIVNWAVSKAVPLFLKSLVDAVEKRR